VAYGPLGNDGKKAKKKTSRRSNSRRTTRPWNRRELSLAVGHTSSMRTWTLAFGSDASERAGAPRSSRRDRATHVQTRTQSSPGRETRREPELFARRSRRQQGDYTSAAKARGFERRLSFNRILRRTILPKVALRLGTDVRELGDRERAGRCVHAGVLLASRRSNLRWPSAEGRARRWCGSTHFSSSSGRSSGGGGGRTGETILAARISIQLKRRRVSARAPLTAELGETRCDARRQNGIDILEDNRIGMAGSSPPRSAQLKFAPRRGRGAWRPRSIQIRPVGDDFRAEGSARCQGILEALRVRRTRCARPPAYAMMAGYRLGDMYRKSTRVRSIPPEGFARPKHAPGLLRDPARPLSRDPRRRRSSCSTRRSSRGQARDQSPWALRGAKRKAQMKSSRQEKTTIAEFPWTEDERSKRPTASCRRKAAKDGHASR